MEINYTLNDYYLRGNLPWTLKTMAIAITESVPGYLDGDTADDYDSFEDYLDDYLMDAIRDAIDDGLYYEEDQWDMLKAYCNPEYADYENAKDNFADDIYTAIRQGALEWDLTYPEDDEEDPDANDPEY